MNHFRFQESRVPLGHILHLCEHLVDQCTGRIVDGRSEAIDFSQAFALRTVDFITAVRLLLEFPVGTGYQVVGAANALESKATEFNVLERKDKEKGD